MTRRILYWPPFLRPVAVQWTLVSRAKSGGVAINGYEQIVGAPDDTWNGELRFVVAGTEDELRNKARAWGVVESMLAGRIGHLVVPTFEVYQLIGGCAEVNDVTHTDGSLFSDGSGYGGVETLTCMYADAPMTSSFVRVWDKVGYTWAAGVKISINGWLHTVLEVLDGGAVGVSKLEIRPGLRMRALAGDRVSLKPLVYGRLAGGDSYEMAMKTVRSGEGTVKIEEVVNRANDGFTF